MDEQDKRIFEEMFEAMPDDLKAAFDSAVAASGVSKEQFVENLWSEVAADDAGLEGDEDDLLRSIFIGDCPECGSTHTLSGDEIEEIDDPTVALCEDCGLIWCLECGMTLAAAEECGHWHICEACDEEKDEYGDCGLMPADCPFVLDWQARAAADMLTGKCAWCGGEIPEGGEVFGTGARIREGIDFVQGGSEDGFFMEVTIDGRRVPTIVTGKDSDARKQGNDLMFMTCSLNCAEELKKALERERDIIEKIQLN